MPPPPRRNDPCPCGSGLRFKACHGRLDGEPAEPPAPEAALERAQLAHQQGRIDEAERTYRAVLERDPGHPVAEHFLGVVDWQRGRLAEAEARMRRSIAARVTAPFRNNLGLVLRDQGRTREALGEFRAALAIDAGYVEAATNLGDTLLREGEIEEAVETLRRATDSPAALVETFYMHALALESAGRDAEALESLRRARERLGAASVPQLSRKVLYRLGQAALRLGLLDEGWDGYAWRPARTAPPAAGELLPMRLDGVTLGIEQEQGLGDTLFFLRYAPAARARGARLAFSGDERLLPILARTGIFEWCEPAATARSVDRRILAGDLPRLLPEAGTAATLRLAPLPERVEKARAALAGLRAPFGVSWRAGTAGEDPGGVLFKEIDPEWLGRALAGTRRDAVSLQRRPAARETARFERGFGRSVRDLSAWNEDLDDALALAAVLDDYAGVSNTNMHLRAAAGKTARVLVPFPPEWRWGASGATSPWFPGFDVLRQTPGKSWDEALRALGAMLYSKA